MIGWIGNLLFVLGAVFLAFKKPLIALTFNCGANLLYICYAITTNATPLVFLSIFLAILNIIGIYNYSKRTNELNGKLLLRKCYE